ncbi:MAG: hypothetical protein ACM3JI_01445, partial [Anaerolineae bacterium]
GKYYYVRFRPILFNRQFNFFSKLEKILPGFLSGQSKAREISNKGNLELKAFVEQKIKKLEKELKEAQTRKKKNLIHDQLMLIQKCLFALENHPDDLLPEEELLYRDLLSKLIKLPIVYHCQSSTDRTGVIVALSSTLEQWMSSSQKLPQDPKELLKNDNFKELFTANLMIGHQISRYSRSGEGKIDEKPLKENQIGLIMHRGIFQNPILPRLLPKRYLREFFASQTICHLKTQIQTTPVLKKISAILNFIGISWIIAPLSLVSALIPDKIIDESSSFVKNKQLLLH